MSVKLFEVQDGKVKVLDETLLIPEFNSIYTKFGKDKAGKYFSFIYFLCDFKSPYSTYDNEIIEEKVKNDFIPDMEVTEQIKLAIWKYKEFQDTPSMRLLTASKRACEEMRKFLETINLNERTKAGTPVYKPADISKALVDVPKIQQSLDMLEESVMREHMLGKTRAGKYISARED